MTPTEQELLQAVLHEVKDFKKEILHEVKKLT